MGRRKRSSRENSEEENPAIDLEAAIRERLKAVERRPEAFRFL